MIYDYQSTPPEVLKRLRTVFSEDTSRDHPLQRVLQSRPGKSDLRPFLIDVFYPHGGKLRFVRINAIPENINDDLFEFFGLWVSGEHNYFPF